ncbi:MAG: hypothetical protein V1790_18210, partial [Planctomycetota bacterium]
PPCASPREYETERQLMTMSGCVVPRRKSQIISALFLKTYDFAVLKMGQTSRCGTRRGPVWQTA